ncbi:hypothetical protein [Corynebacterium stationis]|uniref:hypothetical protein n=1 Tax=Corynebacterium stationis TaxID=1705 RepID=UPI00076F86EF|nr:hypothetical protein [Corynebacterium stationis]AMJ44731.1 hypothetical protein AW169_07380 [Corynebacterium stationis]AQX71187.1 hypothetical protein CA21670_06565 [Corynebacterium stationis]ASJ18878.1 hypothetical protein BA700_07375 [Corynebacterium stationis]HJG63214.1 family 17 glucosidase [Corynebacterium stationis]
MRTKLAAVITAAAVTLTPVSVANANAVELPSSTADITGLSSALDFEGLSSKVKADGLSSNTDIPGLSSTAKDRAKENPGHAALLDVVITVGLWAILGSIYGSLIAPLLPNFNLYDIAPFLRG